MGITIKCEEQVSVEFKLTSDLKYIDHRLEKKVLADFLIERLLLWRKMRQRPRVEWLALTEVFSEKQKDILMPFLEKTLGIISPLRDYQVISVCLWQTKCSIFFLWTINTDEVLVSD